MVDPIQLRSSPLPTDNDPSAPALPPPMRQAPNPDLALATALANAPGTSADVIRAMTDGPPAPLQQVAATGAGSRADAMQATLNAFMRSTSGPYRVAGEVAWAPSQFRMTGGYNDRAIQTGGKVAAPMQDLVAVATRAHLPATDLGAVQTGRGTPAQVVRVTQMLIDAGRLPAGPEPVGDRIRSMQWSYAVGIDCAGYVQSAFLASRGATRSAYGLTTPVNENLAGLVHNPSFRKVDPASAMTGDVCVLGVADNFGHTAIVYAHTTVAPADQSKLIATYGDRVRPMLAGGRVHLLEMDSSWGTGDKGEPWGGVHRETWLYNEASDQWARMDLSSNRLEVTNGRPYHHPLVGFFRPRRES